jgi:hypothetical protein
VVNDELPFTQAGKPISVVANLGADQFDCWPGYLEKAVSVVFERHKCQQADIDFSTWLLWEDMIFLDRKLLLTYPLLFSNAYRLSNSSIDIQLVYQSYMLGRISDSC